MRSPVAGSTFPTPSDDGEVCLISHEAMGFRHCDNRISQRLDRDVHCGAARFADQVMMRWGGSQVIDAGTVTHVNVGDVSDLLQHIECPVHG